MGQASAALTPESLAPLRWAVPRWRVRQRRLRARAGAESKSWAVGLAGGSPTAGTPCPAGRGAAPFPDCSGQSWLHGWTWGTLLSPAWPPTPQTVLARMHPEAQHPECGPLWPCAGPGHRSGRTPWRRGPPSPRGPAAPSRLLRPVWQPLSLESMWPNKSRLVGLGARGSLGLRPAGLASWRRGSGACGLGEGLVPPKWGRSRRRAFGVARWAPTVPGVSSSADRDLSLGQPAWQTGHRLAQSQAGPRSGAARPCLCRGDPAGATLPARRP